MHLVHHPTETTIKIWLFRVPGKDFSSQSFRQAIRPPGAMRNSSANDADIECLGVGMGFCVRMGGWLTASLVNLQTVGGFTCAHTRNDLDFVKVTPPQKEGWTSDQNKGCLGSRYLVGKIEFKLFVTWSTGWVRWDRWTPGVLFCQVW